MKRKHRMYTYVHIYGRKKQTRSKKKKKKLNNTTPKQQGRPGLLVAFVFMTRTHRQTSLSHFPVVTYKAFSTAA